MGAFSVVAETNIRTINSLNPREADFSILKCLTTETLTKKNNQDAVVVDEIKITMIKAQGGAIKRRKDPGGVTEGISKKNKSR